MDEDKNPQEQPPQETPEQPNRQPDSAPEPPQDDQPDEEIEESHGNDIDFEDDGEGPEDTSDQTTTTPQQSQPQQTSEDDIDSVVQNRVDEALKPIMEQSNAIRVQNEWGQIEKEWPEIGNHPQMKSKILRYANHESYRNKPVMQAVMDVGGADLFAKIGAMRAKQADTEAQKRKGSRGGYRPSQNNSNPNGMPSFKGKTQQEIEQLRAQWRAGEFS